MENETRRLTDAERRYVEWWLKSGLLKMGPGVGDKIVLSCMTAGCLTAITFGLVAIVLKVLLSIAATSLAARNFRASEWFGRGIFALPILLWAGMLFYFFAMRRRKPPPDTQEPRKPIQQDLSEGIATIHRLRATDVMLAYSDQRRERNYFVRLDDGRVLFLGSWRPHGCAIKDMTFLPDEKGFPSTAFEIAATPHNLLILDVVGTGEYLRPVDEFELNDDEDPADDRSRLKAGSFVKTPWEKIRRTFG